MIIKKLHIENFGKLKDFTLDLNSGLNEIYNQNGFGKTTLSIFIKAMFYGMPPARENIKMDRKKYMPWQGGNFGGHIEFEQDDKSYRITRFFGKTPESDSFELLNLQNNKIISLKGKEPGEEFFGIGKETFEMTAFFPQLNFSVISNQQISANLLGLDKFKYDLANLNTAVALIKKKIADLKREKPNKEDMNSINVKLQNYKNEILDLKNKLKEIENKVNEKSKEISLAEEKVVAEKAEKQRQSQAFVVKQKFENEILDKQQQLNQLLIELNNINESSKPKEKDKDSKKIFFIALLVLSVMAIMSGAVLLALNFQIVLSCCVMGIFAVILILAIIGLTKRKNQADGNLQFKQERALIENKISLCRQQIELIDSNLKIYQTVENPSMEELELLNNNLYQEKLNFQTLLYEKERLIDNIDELNEECENLNNLYLKKEEYLNELNKKILLLTKTKDFLIQANENVSTRFVEPANKVIKEILTKFDIKNREFIVDTNFDIKEVTPVGVKEQEYSSQGYKDILAFCVRLYFLKEIYKNDKPFIILDDTFVNLDDENMTHAKEIVNELEKDYQIIYLCCNSRCKLR